MFRLIKLGFYALVGYALYEVFQGMTAQPGGSTGGDSNLNRALNQPGGRMQTLTGEGRGQREQSLEPDGGSIPHQVGRGVVSAAPRRWPSAKSASSTSAPPAGSGDAAKGTA